MRKLLAIAACLILLSLVIIPGTKVYSQRRDTDRQLYADDQIVVKLKAGLPSDDDLMAAEIVRAPGVRAEDLGNRRQIGLQVIHLNKNLSVEEAVSRARLDPRVEYAEPDYFFHATDKVPDDDFFKSGWMWGLSTTGCTICTPSRPAPSIDATQAWEITTGSDDVVAVVLDTGVDLQHEDLAANAWVNPGEIPGNGKDDDGNGFADDVNGWSFFDGTNETFKNSSEDFHGTHVAGSIGAVGDNGKGVTGVAWHVKIMSLKFLGGPKGNGSTSNAVRGINYAIDMRNRGINVRVINASWGGGSNSQALRDAIAAANNAGILFVCAAGNGGTNIDDEPDFPASYSVDLPNAISVAAVDSVGSLASFSNTGHSSVSLAAPGVFIYSTLPHSPGVPGGSYGQLSGTSMSTPYVSGIAVLLWSHEPSLSPKDVKQRIIDTSEPLVSLLNKAVRSGRASAFNALTSPPRIAPKQTPVVLGVEFTKKVVTINGFGFEDGSAVIIVDGTPLPTVSYDSSFALANSTLTQLTANLGKKPLKKTFPLEVPVTVQVFNPSTQQTSPGFSAMRF